MARKRPGSALCLIGEEMEDIAALYDLLSISTGEDWQEICAELLEAGYRWEHWAGTQTYHLLDY